jgi:hypothetical protein
MADTDISGVGAARELGALERGYLGVHIFQRIRPFKASEATAVQTLPNLVNFRYALVLMFKII